MGTISEKLVYLNGTKQAIKQAINEDFEVIDNNTTFREYADEISSNNAKYKDLIPKETKNATNTLDISNSAGLDKTLVTQYGNTYQYSTSGKNLLNTSLLPIEEYGLKIFKNDNGDIVINGTPNWSSGYRSFMIGNTSTSEATTYTLSITNKRAGFGLAIGNGNINITMADETSTKTYTFTNTFTINPQININYNAGTFNNVVINPQLEKGNQTSYEPYTGGIPAPNPDYPQDIQVVTGDNSINVVGKNLLDLPNVSTTSNGVTSTITNGKLKIVGTATTNWFSICNLNIPLESGTYIFSYTNKKVNRYNFRIKYEDNTTQVIYGNTYSNTPITLNKNATITSMFSDNNTTGATFDYEDYLMLEKGSTATTYEAYKGQSFDLDLKSRNLFDISTITENTYIDERGYTGSSRVSNLSDYIELKPNASYTLSYDYSTLLNSTQRDFVYYDENKTNISGLTYSPINKTRTFTTPNNAKYLRFSYDKNCNSIMLNEGSTIQAYEPFYDINLCKIGNYKDRIYPLNGKWYLEKKIGKVVLDGSENWGNFNIEPSGLGRAMVSSSNVYYNSNENTIMASNMVGVKYGGSWNKTYDCIATSSSNKFIAYLKNASDLATFKSILNNSNSIVYYVLATPTTEEITENNYPTLYNQLNNIKLFEGVNHITMTNESGLDVEFDIEYYKDWKLD